MKILQPYVIRFHPEYLIVTFDTKQSKSSNFRNELLGSYKIHRSENLRVDHEDFNNQMKVVKKILKYLNIPVVWDNKGLGHESDDYIGYYAMEHSRNRGKVTIVSSDKDFCQLLGPNVKIFNPFKETLINSHTCRDIMGYSPEECVDYLCLLGDKSDDIPGYKGIGEIKARQFLDQFGSIEKFLRNPKAEFKGIDRDGLADLYERNLELISLEVALERHPLKKIPIKYSPIDSIQTEKLKDIFRDYKFKSLMTSDFIKPFEKLKTWHPKKN